MAVRPDRMAAGRAAAAEGQGQDEARRSCAQVAFDQAAAPHPGGARDDIVGQRGEAGIDQDTAREGAQEAATVGLGRRGARSRTARRMPDGMRDRMRTPRPLAPGPGAAVRAARPPLGRRGGTGVA